MVEDRVGDYVHALSRVVNTFFQRLLQNLPELAVRQDIRHLRDELIASGKHLAAGDQKAPRSPLPLRSLDLSSSLLFLRSEARRGLFDCATGVTSPASPQGLVFKWFPRNEQEQ